VKSERGKKTERRKLKGDERKERKRSQTNVHRKRRGPVKQTLNQTYTYTTKSDKKMKPS